MNICVIRGVSIEGEELAQIQEQAYYKPLRLQGKKLVLIGTSFDEENRNIKEWKTLEIDDSK